MITCLSSVVSSFSKYLCDFSCSNAGNLLTFKSNCSDLQQELQGLNKLKSRVDEIHDESVSGVNEWLRKVEETNCQVRQMQASMDANRERCCGGFKNLFLRSRQGAEALKEVR